jgi:hypothetical protein
MYITFIELRTISEVIAYIDPKERWASTTERSKIAISSRYYG